jgi:hypothetical protein
VRSYSAILCNLKSNFCKPIFLAIFGGIGLSRDWTESVVAKQCNRNRHAHLLHSFRKHRQAMTSLTQNLPWFVKDLGISIIGKVCTLIHTHICYHSLTQFDSNAIYP